MLHSNKCIYLKSLQVKKKKTIESEHGQSEMNMERDRSENAFLGEFLKK